MLSNATLPQGPLYDPKSKVQNFRFEEDFENIRLNLSGTNYITLYSDPKFYYYLGSDKEWRRPKEIAALPHFIKDDKPNRFDAIQGNSLDGWFVAGMEALTLNDTLMKHVVPPNQSFQFDYIGAFHFRFWQLGTWYDVVVDDRLPVWKKNKRLCYVHSKTGDVFWAALLEKAYAKLCGSTYDNLESGISITALQDLSGGIVEPVLTDYLPRDITIKWYMKNLMSNDALICCGTLKEIHDERTDIMPSKAYSITSVFQSPQDAGLLLIRIMNTIGHNEWKGDFSDESQRWKEIDLAIRKQLDVKSQDDGEFWMDDRDFVRYFKKIYICHLGPGQYIESHRGGYVGTWRTTSFFGQWKKKISSGGSNIATRHLNPQYRILLEKNDFSDMCSVVIELVQRAKFERKIRKPIGVYVYSLENVTPPPPMPLDFIFFNLNDALNERDVTFSVTEKRSFVTHLRLNPGKYCLVPCTRDINVELQYLLRVYSESRVEMWEYDTKISKSIPLEDERLAETDIELKNIFKKVANSQDEIDWIGLKELLEKTMNSNLSTFAKIVKVAQKMYQSFFSSSPSEDDTIVFSKDDCRSMIAMLDDNRSGKLSYSEFSNLWNKICFWSKVYKNHIDENEGSLSVSQLREALGSAGYNVNTPILNVITSFHENEQEKVLLNEFILCGVRLETAMSLYHKKYAESDNEFTFTLEEWVKNTLYL